MQHVLDLFCLKIINRGVFFSSVSPVSVLTLKCLELMRHETGRHCGTSVVTDLKSKVPWETKGPRSYSVMLLKGSQVAARSQELGWSGELDRWSVVRSTNVKKASWIFGCPVVERNKVFAENDSSLLLWSRQWHNCIIFFHLLLQDGEGQNNTNRDFLYKVLWWVSFLSWPRCTLQNTENQRQSIHFLTIIFQTKSIFSTG